MKRRERDAQHVAVVNTSAPTKATSSEPSGRVVHRRHGADRSRIVRSEDRGGKLREAIHFFIAS
jgi:hypothetical protein